MNEQQPSALCDLIQAMSVNALDTQIEVQTDGILTACYTPATSLHGRIAKTLATMSCILAFEDTGQFPRTLSALKHPTREVDVAGTDVQPTPRRTRSSTRGIDSIRPEPDEQQ